MRQNFQASATYKKIEEGEFAGEWGVWCDLPDAKVGQTITVTTAKGGTKAERLKQRIWLREDGQLSLWRIHGGDKDL